MTKTTIYLDPKLRAALKLKAVQTDQSVSALINEAVAEALTEDMHDLKVLKERVNDSAESYEDFLDRLRADGRI